MSDDAISNLVNNTKNNDPDGQKESSKELLEQCSGSSAMERTTCDSLSL